VCVRTISSIRPRFNRSSTSVLLNRLRNSTCTCRGPRLSSISMAMAQRSTSKECRYLSRPGSYMSRADSDCRMSKRAVRLAWNRKSKWKLFIVFYLWDLVFRLFHFALHSSFASGIPLDLACFAVLFLVVSTVPCLSMAQRQECRYLGSGLGPYLYVAGDEAV
jgi:hypothetical protein